MSGLILKFQSLLHIILLSHALILPAQASDSSLFDDEDLEEKIARVNEGQLHFLDTPPDKPPHHHHNRITITASSLDNGWVKLHQCHQHLDPTAAIDIRFNAQRIRNIEILSKQNIGNVKVNGHTVELQDIKPNATLCLKAESRALQRTGKNSLRLRNGPFMRQFLDGFYPMQVTMDISWPDQLMQLDSYHPEPGHSGGVIATPNSISWKALFEGRLYTAFTFWQVR